MLVPPLEFLIQLSSRGRLLERAYSNRFLSDVEAISPGLTLKTTAQVKLRGSAAASNYNLGQVLAYRK